MAFDSEDVRAFFADETAAPDHSSAVWGYYNRSGRREGHDIPRLPREATCAVCRRTFGTAHALRMHLLPTGKRPSNCSLVPRLARPQPRRR